MGSVREVAMDSTGRVLLPPRHGGPDHDWGVQFGSNLTTGPYLLFWQSVEPHGSVWCERDKWGWITLPKQFLKAGGFARTIAVENVGPYFEARDEIGWALESAQYRGNWNETVDGSPLTEELPQDRRCAYVVDRVNDQLLSSLVADPNLLYGLRPRAFETLVAELLADAGFTTVLTSLSNDAGVDIYAVEHRQHGPAMLVVDCKRYHAGAPVGVSLVRQLAGAIWEQDADAGMLVTTSRFTAGARKMAAQYPHRILLRDLEDVIDMLKDSVRRRAPTE